ncbi:Signal transduction histidine kinase [Catalinimonas alkaloidigena]|uniref:histidine kinase n=1 Tax=Catalinimonas alkaloidigena TaxID=1075417 RepID=A0A1G9LLS6_9BACT|nr:two-component regulator propeller domain-containing protein [Catalinimonas alkaloidigena]SDL62920.1 Signal transduction histidine kinase [Catalinimonas alkaloidigena]
MLVRTLTNLLFLLSLLLSAGVRGQTAPHLFTQYKFHRLNEANGLTNNIVTDIVQDSLGQIWVGTEEGLFRYQGTKFQPFLKDREDTNTLPNNYVWKLFVDEQNNIWTMTDNGVGMYSYQTDCIRRFMPEQLVGGVTSMARAPDGTLYFGRYEGGIWQVRDGQARLLPLFDPVSQQNMNGLGVLHMSIAQNTLWAVVSERGLLSIDLATERVRYLSAQEICGQERLKVFDLYVDAEARVWLGSNAGVFRSDPSPTGAGAFRPVLTDALPPDDYLSICLDNTDQLWVGSRQHGVYAFRQQPEGTYRPSEHFAPSFGDDGISHRTISKIFQDDEGLFWLGTHNGGVNVFNPEGELVRFLTYQFYNPASLSYQNVWGMCEVGDGTIWVGTDGKGINRLDPKTGVVDRHFLPDLQDKAILCLMEDSRSRVWIGTYANGVYLYDRRSDRLSTFRVGSEHTQLQVNDIRAFFETPSGKVYVGTNQDGLYTFEEETGRLVQVVGSAGLDIRAITSTRDQQLWLGTYGQGLLHYDERRGSFTNHHWAQHDEFAKEVIFDIYRDGSTLWLGTRHHGLLAFDTQTLTYTHFADVKRINESAISGVTKDALGNLWITTNTEVIAFDPVQRRVFPFSSNGNFQTGHANYGSIFRADAGFVVVGGINGMNLFYPEQLFQTEVTRNVVFNELKILNKTANAVNSDVFPAGKSIFLTDRVMLDHKDNIFSIGFSIPGFNVSKQNEVAYRLEGYETEWQYGANDAATTYRNVPPGHYTFQVKNLQTDTLTRQLAIAIAPPFWRTWQAYGLYALVLALLIWWFNRFMHSRIILKQKLAFEKELREKEHHVMQEKLRFYTNFSHELKTPLTLIQGPVNDLARTIEDPDQRQYLQLIQKNTRILLKFIERMLEFRKLEMNKTILNVGRHNLTILAQEEAERFAYLAKEKRIKFGFYCESELHAWVDLEKMQIILSNLLSNAIKFTGEGKAIHFGIAQHQEQLVIEVKDDGVGIEATEVKNIFSPFYQASNSVGAGGTGIGLALCKSLVELHGGTITVRSQAGKGTQFRVQLPLGKDHLLEKPHVRFVVTDAETQEAPRWADSEQQLAADESAVNDQVMLVVDDNQDILTYVHSLFKGEFRVITAENGKEALEKATHHIPDLIISDMMMPEMDGIALSKALKENMATSHIPIILLTAKNSNQAKIDGFEIGVDDYITKPFHSELLLARVKNILNKRKLLELKYGVNELMDPATRQGSREEDFVLQVEAAILGMLEKGTFEVPELCREMGMSQTSLYRKIKSIAGVSTQLFIRKIKVKRAAQLMLQGQGTITEIAYALDFADLKYFRKCFKEQYQMTPSEFIAAHPTAAPPQDDLMQAFLDVKK